MTKQEAHEIIDILEELERNEMKRCERYCDLNPTDATHRRAHLSAYRMAITEMRLRLKTYARDHEEGDD